MDEKLIYKVLDKWMAERLTSHAAINKLKKAFVYEEKKASNIYDLLVKKSVKLAQIKDSMYMDLTAKQMLKEIGIKGGVAEAVLLGKALNRAGAISKIHEGINHYRVLKIRRANSSIIRNFNII